MWSTSLPVCFRPARADLFGLRQGCHGPSCLCFPAFYASRASSASTTVRCHRGCWRGPDRGRRSLTTPRSGSKGVVDQKANFLRCRILSSAEEGRSLRRTCSFARPLTTSRDWTLSVDNQDPRSIFLEPEGQVVVSCSDGSLDGEGNILRAGVGANSEDREAKALEALDVMLPQLIFGKLRGSERMFAEVELLAARATKRFCYSHLEK